ncbi:hypothetical protein [uncultured Tessaracoccus sp.]|uniref:hypothetical protein n=1 Tax=uncultured Tessaracoccus sp. TaxID=905023 RepID=UPI00260C343C|nr:hypothetical protein [uncultured Tessaracoccus sp.]
MSTIDPRVVRTAEAHATATLALIEATRHREEAEQQQDSAIDSALRAGVPLRQVARLSGFSHVTIRDRFTTQ